VLIPHKKSPCRPDAFDISCSTLFKNERIVRHRTERLANLDAIRNTMRFHASGNIHGITPRIARKARIAYNAGRCVATMQPNAQQQAPSTEPLAVVGASRSTSASRPIALAPPGPSPSMPATAM